MDVQEIPKYLSVYYLLVMYIVMSSLLFTIFYDVLLKNTTIVTSLIIKTILYLVIGVPKGTYDR